MTDLPEPLTPPDCDLQGMSFMPLHVTRLRDSDLAAIEAPEACWYAVLLWAAAWHQIPAASVPDDDAVLTRLVGLGRDVKTFRRHRNGALRGFVKCSDGRLYHPIVAEEAMKTWASRQAHQEAASGEKTRKEREREERKRMFGELAAAGINLPWNTKTGDLRTRHAEAGLSREPVTPPVTTGHAESVTGHAPVTPPVTAKTGTGTGTGTIPPTPKPVTPHAERLHLVMEAGRFTSPPNDGKLIDDWITAGADFEQDILPVVRTVSQRMIDAGRGPFKLRAFDAAIREKLAADQAEIDRLRNSAARSRRFDEQQLAEQEQQRREDEEWARRNGSTLPAAAE